MRLGTGLAGLTLASVVAFGSVSAMALISAATAADMYAPGAGGSKDGPYLAGPLWSGFYIGLNIGYGVSPEQDVLYAYPGEAPAVKTGLTLQPQGLFAGGQAGYNYQMGRFVLGGEADFQGSDINDGYHVLGRIGNPTDDTSLSSDLKYFGTVRGRLGYSFDRTLLYVTGGFAYGDVKVSNSYYFPCTVCGVGPLTGASTKSETVTGFAVGGGTEYALSGNWSLKAEYQYIDLGSVDVVTPRVFNNGVVVNPQTTSVDLGFHTARLGLNYKLGSTYEPLK